MATVNNAQGASLMGVAMDWKIVTASLLSPFVLTYLITVWNSSTTIRQWRDPTRPLTAPYYLPYIGHAVVFATSPSEFFEATW